LLVNFDLLAKGPIFGQQIPLPSGDDRLPENLSFLLLSLTAKNRWTTP
jgi:hypothetical protein